LFSTGFGREVTVLLPVADRFKLIFAKRAAERSAAARSLVRDRSGCVLALELLVMSALSAGTGFDASHHHLRRRS